MYRRITTHSRSAEPRRATACWLLAALLAGLGPAMAAPSAEPGPLVPPEPAAATSVLPPVAWMLEPVPVPEAVAASAEEMQRYTEVIPGTSAKFEMIPIPGGSFTLGSPDGEAGRAADEGPQFAVELEPFWMGKCEVTWDEYELWGMGMDKQRRRILRKASTVHDKLADAVTMPTKPYSDMSFGWGKKTQPALCMTQLAAKMYCKWLSAKTGRYYRLPTEAEWEYACRAGSTTPYSFGADPQLLDQFAWYAANSGGRPQPVGQKEPNAWGLHDMHGNVAEWVLDQYVPEGYRAPAANPARNPVVLPTTIYPRTVRGGSWKEEPDRLRSAARQGSSIAWMAQDPQIPRSVWYHTDATHVGFRVVRPLRTPSVEEAALYDLDSTQGQEMIDYVVLKTGWPQ